MLRIEFYEPGYTQFGLLGIVGRKDLTTLLCYKSIPVLN